jgi:hypothetical protein
MRGFLELAAEGLVKDGFFEGVEGGELLLVEVFEALGVFAKGVELVCNAELIV